MKWTNIALSTLLVFGAAPVFAHHPFTPEFDWTKPITLNGTITKVEWSDPHVLVQLKAKDRLGAAVEWKIELGSPKALGRFGWSAQSVKVGDRVSVEGWLARDGVKFVSAKSFALPDGQELFAASSFFDLPYRLTYGALGACVSGEFCLDMEHIISTH